MIRGHVKENFTVELTDGDHVFLSDVTKDEGGDNQGPSPHEILEASLVACTAMTLMMYAKRKHWPLVDVKVEVHIESEAAETQFGRVVEFVGTLSAEQRTRLLEIANRCPVHRLLTGNIQIRTSLIPLPKD